MYHLRMQSRDIFYTSDIEVSKHAKLTDKLRVSMRKRLFYGLKYYLFEGFSL